MLLRTRGSTFRRQSRTWGNETPPAAVTPLRVFYTVCGSFLDSAMFVMDDEELRELATRYEAGEDIAKLLDDSGMSLGTFIKYISNFRSKRRQNRHHPNFQSHCGNKSLDDLKKMLMFGFNCGEIAEQLGLTRQAVYAYLARHDVDIASFRHQKFKSISLRIRPHTRECRRQQRRWRNMLQRCYKPKNKMFKYYGARGITVCERWRHSFGAFHHDMGFPPTAKHSIDRKDNNGHYCPENCRWATSKQQCNNRRQRAGANLSFNGITKTITEWSRSLGIHAETIRQRLRKGLPVEKALSPVEERYRRSAM